MKTPVFSSSEKTVKRLLLLIKSLFSYMGRPVAEMKSVTGLLL